MSFGEAVITIFWFCMLSNCSVNWSFYIKTFKISLRNLCIFIKTNLFLEFFEHSIIGVSLILPPAPWLLLFLFKMLNLPKSSLNIHNIRWNSIEMAVVWIIISCVNIIVILAIPGDIIERILNFADHFISILVALLLTFSITCLFKFFYLEEFTSFSHLFINDSKQVFISGKADLNKVFFPIM